MSVAENKTILRRYFEELFDQQDLSVADKIVAENYINHNALPGEAPGRAGLQQWVAYLHSTFPDIHFSVEDQIAEGDKVVTRFRITGTQQGEFMGIPATGKQADVTAINIHRLVDGKVQEAWLEWDSLGFLRQLGVTDT